jgi:hypothetical protein
MTTAHRLQLICGPLAAAQIVIVTAVDGATRTGYDPWRHWVSHLALGDRGWLGMASLTVGGILLIIYAIGLRRALGPGRAPRWRAGLVLLAGVGLVVAGMFRIDPGLGYPPGVPGSHSTSGTVHDLAGGVVFVSLTGAAALLGRSLRGVLAAAAPLGYLIATLVALSFVACSVLVGLDYAGALPDAPSGLLERLALYLGLCGLGAVAVLLRDRRA